MFSSTRFWGTFYVTSERKGILMKPNHSTYTQPSHLPACLLLGFGDHEHANYIFRREVTVAGNHFVLKFHLLLLLLASPRDQMERPMKMKANETHYAEFWIIT